MTSSLAQGALLVRRSSYTVLEDYPIPGRHGDGLGVTRCLGVQGAAPTSLSPDSHAPSAPSPKHTWGRTRACRAPTSRSRFTDDSGSLLGCDSRPAIRPRPVAERPSVNTLSSGAIEIGQEQIPPSRGIDSKLGTSTGDFNLGCDAVLLAHS